MLHICVQCTHKATDETVFAVGLIGKGDIWNLSLRIATLLISNLWMDRRKGKHQESLEWLDLFVSFATFFFFFFLFSKCLFGLWEDSLCLMPRGVWGCQHNFLSQVSRRLCYSLDQKRSCWYWSAVSHPVLKNWGDLSLFPFTPLFSEYKYWHWTTRCSVEVCFCLNFHFNGDLLTVLRSL